MSCIFAFIAIILVQNFHAISGEQVQTEIVDNWNAGFKGKISINLNDSVTSGWIMILSFPVAVPNLQIWRAKIVGNQNNRVYTLKNMPWNAQMRKGVFELFFLAQKAVFKDSAPIGNVVFRRRAPATSYPRTTGPSSPQQSTAGPTPSSPSTNLPSTPQPSTSHLSSPQPSSNCSSLTPPKTTNAATAKATTSSPPYPGKYDYAQVLKLSILFYEAQRSGKLPWNNRVPWRKDSALNDRGENGEDLSGGWYDASDYVKFGFPMASSATVLAWGLIEYKKAYEASGQYDLMLDNIKWIMDYFIKAHTKKEEFYGQVGDGHLDHAYWGRPEDMTMARPAFKITPQKPGSDLAAETAAALAAAAIAFKARNTQSSELYAEKLLQHAKELYAFADKYRGVYSDSISNAASFYRSYSGYKDELVWGAIWLYRATTDTSFLAKAERYYNEFGMNGQAWAFSWDDKKAGVQLLLAALTKKTTYQSAIQSSLDSWLPGGSVTYTPKGLAWRAKWGSNRYAANTAFLALVAADQGFRPATYREFAKKQIHYMLGDSGRSFVVGFGHNPPQRPHHSSSSCPSAPAPCDWSNFHDPSPNAHVLKGALVGGPDQNDNYKDDRTNYVTNEVATDYNAGFQSAVAGLKQLQLNDAGPS